MNGIYIEILKYLDTIINVSNIINYKENQKFKYKNYIMKDKNNTLINLYIYNNLIIFI